MVGPVSTGPLSHEIILFRMNLQQKLKESEDFLFYGNDEFRICCYIY